MNNLPERIFNHPYYQIIRKKIISLAVIFIVFFLIGFSQSGFVIKTILGLFDLKNVTISTTSPFQLLNLSTTIAMIIGITAFLMVLMFHIYNFMKDGLRKKERTIFFFLLFMGIILFCVGVFYGFSVLSFYLNLVSKMNTDIGIQNIWDITSFLSQMIFTSIFLGFVFQFPIILTFLIKVGMLKVNYLKRKRKFAYIIIFIFVGFLPPPDLFSTLIEAFPLILLYELAIIMNSNFKTIQKEQEI